MLFGKHFPSTLSLLCVVLKHEMWTSLDGLNLSLADLLNYIFSANIFINDKASQILILVIPSFVTTDSVPIAM